MGPENPRLSSWVRKQRTERSRKERGLDSALSDERERMLTSAGFIWDAHRAKWQEMYQSLEDFQRGTGTAAFLPTFRIPPFWTGSKTKGSSSSSAAGDSDNENDPNPNPNPAAVPVPVTT